MRKNEILMFILVGTFQCIYSETSETGLNGVCMPGYFPCDNETLCIPRESNCDAIIDCPNASDENNCDDIEDDYYWDHRFKKRPGAVSDDEEDVCILSYNGICRCKQTKILCNSKGLNKIPTDLPSESISLLDFDGNDFKTLTRNLLAELPQQIEILNMASCNINEIQSGSFYLQTFLKELHLDNNNLHTFPPDLFTVHNRLQILSLIHNHISTINPDAFQQFKKLIHLDLSNNQITEIHSNVFTPLNSLRSLYLQNNKLEIVTNSSFPSIPLEELSLIENRIESLDTGSFACLLRLKRLFLSNNRIRHLHNGVFYNLSQLTVLTLNDNLIETIGVLVFYDTPNVRSLLLERNSFRKLDTNIFTQLTKLEYIYFDRFELCEAALHARVCYPKGDGISDHEHLLENVLLRISVWIMALVGCTGNLTVLLGRSFSHTNNVVHSLYLVNLAFSDLLMGIYLFTIAIADHHYRGVYLKYQYSWRHSHLCNLCGFLSTLSSESSVFILTLVTWDRFVSVTQPLAKKQPSPNGAIIILSILWLIALAIASVPFSKGYFGDEYYGNNGVCLPLHIHEPFAMGWQYSAVMFVLINAFALVFICYAYIRMINEIRASSVASCRSTAQGRDKIAQRFGIIILSDCMCWMPIIVIKLVALSNYSISPTLYAWLAIFILPINSALNPLLYTVTTTVFKNQFCKIVNTCIPKKRLRLDQQHSASESGFSFSLTTFPRSNNMRRGRLSQKETQTSLTNTKDNNKTSPTIV